MGTPRKGTPIEALVADYASGLTTVEIGVKYALDQSGVRRRLLRAGVTLRPARVRALYDNRPLSEEAIRLYRVEGISMATIAKRLGTSHSTITRTLAAHDIATRPHGLRDSTIVIPGAATDLAYMAGLFDGEGNLQFKARRGGSVACKLAVYSTTSDVMNWVHRKFGGHLRWDHNRTRLRGWKPIGIWELYRAQDVGRLLAALLPYLIIKRALALEALRLFERQTHLTFASNDDPIDARIPR